MLALVLVYTHVHMYECKYVYSCLCVAGESLVLWSLVLSLQSITTSCLCLQMDYFFPAWLLLLLVQGCTTGDTVDTYVRTDVYTYVACMKFNLAIVWPIHHLSFHMQSCFILLCSVYDYIQSISAEEGVTFNANDANTKQKCAVHNCASPVLDCHATNRILPLSLSPLYLWPTYLGTASLGSVHAGSQHESLAYMRALQESLSAAFKEGKLKLHSNVSLVTHNATMVDVAMVKFGSLISSCE